MPASTTTAAIDRHSKPPHVPGGKGTPALIQSPVQRQLLAIAATAVTSSMSRPKQLPETLASAQELLGCVENKCGLLEVSKADMKDGAGRAWVADARSAYKSEGAPYESDPLLVTANAHRAAMAWACRHLWHSVLGSARAARQRKVASPSAVRGTMDALEGISSVYMQLHTYVPTFDFRACPPEREAKLFRDAIVPVVRRRMAYEASEMARRVCELAASYVSGASDNEPLLDLSTTVVLPLRGTNEEAIVAGWTSEQLECVRKFLDVYTCGPICVTSQVMTNEFCASSRTERLALYN